MSEEKKQGEDDVRLRDLVGRLSSELAKMREEVDAMRKQQEDLAALADEGLGDLEASTLAPGGQPQPQPQPQPQLQPGDRLVRDVTTGEYFIVPGVAQPQPQPKQKPQPETSVSVDSELMRFWRGQYNDLEDDLNYFGKVHPREASKVAANVVEEAIRSGRKVDDVLLEKAADNPAIKTVLLQRLESTGKVLGLTVSPPEPPKKQEPPKPSPAAEAPGAKEASGLPNLPPKETASAEQEAKQIEKALLDRVNSLMP